MDAFEVLHTRRSIRQFLNRPVGEDLVKELLSAAMSAPTAGGIQPWRFVVITDREKLDKIPDFHPYAGMIKQAPLAILVCGDTTSANYRQILGAGLLRRYGKPVACGTRQGAGFALVRRPPRPRTGTGFP